MAGPSSAVLHAAIVVLLLAGTAQAGDYYRVVRRDLRRCSAPMCGGYFLEKVNVNESGTYVGRLDFSQAPPGVRETVDNFTSEFLLELLNTRGLFVYYGDLVPFTFPRGDSVRSSIKMLQVRTAYIGLPGQVTNGSGLTYTIAPGRNTSFANKLNDPTARPVSFRGSSIKAIQPGALLDLQWQLDQIFKKGALVQGTLKKYGQRSTFNLTGVFIKIPVVERPCPLYRIDCNGAGYHVGWTRSADRCFRPTCLNQTLFCPLFIPACSPGYALATWSAPPGGCNRYACDPIFAPPATK